MVSVTTLNHPVLAQIQPQRICKGMSMVMILPNFIYIDQQRAGVGLLVILFQKLVLLI